MKALTLLIYLIIPFSLYSQSDLDKIVKEAEKNICDCTKKTFIKNGVDVIKLEQITNIYKKTNNIPNNEIPTVNKLYKQINSNISNISAGINSCREKFIENPKYKPYFNDQLFTNKLQKALDFNNYYYGPIIIRKLAIKK